MIPNLEMCGDAEGYVGIWGKAKHKLPNTRIGTYLIMELGTIPHQVMGNTRDYYGYTQALRTPREGNIEPLCVAGTPPYPRPRIPKREDLGISWGVKGVRRAV